MSDINKMISDASSMKKKLDKDLQEFFSMYRVLEKEVNHRFQEEFLLNKGKLDDLGDFSMLVHACRKNSGALKSACNLVGRMVDLSAYEINEEKETIKELDEILKD